MPSTSIAEQLARKQKKISISEFFERNKHILGFDSPTRALVSSVKEAVDNSLDAAEEARILPEIGVELKKLSRNEYKVTVEDNGPGIVKRVAPKVFGQLLYGSRFHSFRQARGAQGMGISAVVMYSQLTTGKPSKVRTKVANRDVAYEVELMLDTKRNRPQIIRDDFVIWEKDHGTRFECFVKGRYVGNKQSVNEYLRSTAIVNPHARITYKPPESGEIIFERASDILPKQTREIKPHPQGIELGTLLKMARETKSYKMVSFLQTEFSRISYRVAREILRRAGVPEDRNPKKMTLDDAKAILRATKKVKIMAPPTDCLSPIGEWLIKKGLKNVLGSLRPDYYCPPVTREPSVYSGNPFQVEVGMVYGGDLPKDQPVEILRYANRVPLLYKQGSCACTTAIENIDWRRYGLEQRGGKGVPYGPAVILIHVASTKVPFTSEAKEAIAGIPVIVGEIELALKALGRKLKTHLNKAKKRAKTREKFEIVQQILPEIAAKSAGILGKKVPSLESTMTKIMDVVWIDEKIVYSKKRHKVTIAVYNYTPRRKKLNLHAILPLDHFEAKSANPNPNHIEENGKITWELPRIPPTRKFEISFFLNGLDEEDYDETELYVSGVDMQHIVGAEPLPGDWDIDMKELEELEAEEEIDYDEVEEELEDEEILKSGDEREASEAS